jgi:hypothetical protein
MRAGFSDPQGPWQWRAAPYAIPIAMALFAMAGLLGEFAAWMVGLTSIIVFHLIGLLSLRQGKPRTAELECGPGYVDVKKSGSRNQRIHAKDITGATTARTPHGVSLTLQHRKRDQPVTIDLPSDAEAEKVRHALGIGHGGFGTIAWRTQPAGMARAALVGRGLVVAFALFTVALAAGVSHEAGIIAGMVLGQFALVGAALGIAGLLSRPSDPSVVMASEGLRLRTHYGWFSLPYEGVQNIDDHPRGFVFSVPAPYNSVAVPRVGPLLGGLGSSDREVVVSQIMAAALRARGLGPHKEDVTGRVDVLRRNGESARDWLVRLDMAGQMLSAGPGYRGNTLDAEDLWAILEDPEADAELRAAAARVLRHAPDTRVRIDAAVAAVRDDATHRRLRIAVHDDLDDASEKLTLLDATDPPVARMPWPQDQRHGRRRASP